MTIAKRIEYAEIEKSGGSHPFVNNLWVQLVDIISCNEDDAIKIIDSCLEEELPWVAEVFGDISSKLQSKKFVNYLKQLPKKYPNININVDIEYAEKALKDT